MAQLTKNAFHNKVIAIIPARGESKAVPRKNIRTLLGKPLIAYSIQEAIKSKFIERIIVSTDDEEIAKIAEAYGAEVPFIRPSELGGDDITDLPVFQHALRWLSDNESYKPDIIAHLRPTAPLRTAKHIDSGIEMLIKSDADAVRSVCLAPKHPYKMWRFEDHTLCPFLSESICGKEAYNMPRQQLPDAFIQNGSIDITRWNTVMAKNSMTGERILGMLMQENESVNIDTEIDLMIAEIILRLKLGNC
jgi:N-acylneuraminate cytidylyltransferase